MDIILFGVVGIKTIKSPTHTESNGQWTVSGYTGISVMHNIFKVPSCHVFFQALFSVTLTLL